MSAFHSFFFRNNGVWKCGDEKKIAKSVSTYLVRKFDGYTQKTLTDYLEIRFNTANAGELTDKVYNEILKPLDAKATLLFWKEPTYQIENASPHGYCYVPDSAAVISAATKKLEQVSPELLTVTSKIADRISVVRCAMGIPMYAYAGTREYLEIYRKDKSVGKHLYECTKEDPRDWRKLPDLVPFSMIQEKTGREKELEFLYEEAVKQGIIRQDPENEFEYQIVVKPPIDELVSAVKRAVKEKNLEKLEELLRKVEKLSENPDSDKIYIIPNDGSWGYKEVVSKDYVMASPEYIQIIRKELETSGNPELLKQGIKDYIRDYRKNHI